MKDTISLCECDCGRQVAKAKNKYINGHQNRGKKRLPETIEKLRLAAISKIHSEETRKKISASLKGHNVSKITRKKLSVANTGKKHTLESKQKMSDANKGRIPSIETRQKQSKAQTGKNNSMYGKRGKDSPLYGRKLTPEAREKIRKALKGKKFTERHKKNIGDSIRGKNNPMYGRRGKNSPLYGKKRSEESKQKMRDARQGKGNAAWLGGISFKPYAPEFNGAFKRQIRKRDNYTCQICGKHESELMGYQKKHHVHHIDYDKKNNTPENMITLCNSPCHQKTNTKGDRRYWAKYFTNKNDDGG